ncbi:Coiled-coil domain-containing protein 94 [Dirofilaria immitis]|nr:Coiled-coil domain-containing protein 94 [Dirofilaria immitis]
MTGTERKVFQKYYPPDFDPSKIPRAKDSATDSLYSVCPNCLAEITFKTDLQNCDYQQEHGATRLFEAFKLYQQEEKAKETKEEEEKKDPMKMLEKRTKMSRAEMEALGKLEELQETNRRHETFGPDQYFQNLIGAQAEALRLQEEEDEKFIQKLYGRMKDGKVIKRISDGENEEMNLPAHMKQEIKLEPVKGDQKASCSFVDIANVKPSTAGQSIMMAHKRTSQKELLSRIVDIKKQRTGRNESVIVKTENQDTNNSFEDTPEYSKLKKLRKIGNYHPYH